MIKLQTANVHNLYLGLIIYHIGTNKSIISNNIQNKRLFFGVKGVENKEQI